ncbi:indole-3-glycerol phosphate synthase TrpC [Staphylococcus sp. NRL 16/872]|uniref:indole-3-glycerol phosphate synthase TrpC n=1 Tax=Staphylococcus sp. NRL 16/872 TaxID=2930131 RepID=UPI001FB52164|nr:MULTISPECIES: indole-3-glycerol phosphate synthase TrpC [unclassified Staphylococcus]MCJ1656408.1 indole-3-glycerol phosphate synthase TrpC [Staphylococcus sp. NRL 21/187]MCJ1662173.1 indole-3-glycerol phosphate synthase TrpC [Staphylococcus sp. NRL 18/288]MCJ1668243.1 indole-3-glycerol phosphate synthase TrpC [Staphylococcus sp. NRL 19/737]WEN68441.1 indole-3-glycerol phosphate synthase TrpC [Staphylococcus sp. NRL 16/872]
MTILDEIVEYKEQLLNKGYYDEKLTTLENIDVSHKSKLVESLKTNSRLNIIAEIKLKSPSVSAFHERNLVQQVKDYEKYGANAISILTDEQYFGGSFERLQELTLQTNLPVLCKDFIIHPLQIDVAKKAGASLVLLIVNILTDNQLCELYTYASNLELEVLVEVHDEAELERTYQLNPEIIGVNNRDLKTFITRVAHTNQILRNKKQGYYYISESGINTKKDVENIIQSGIDGLLIGGALMNCHDLSSFLPSLKLPKVKHT